MAPLRLIAIAFALAVAPVFSSVSAAAEAADVSSGVAAARVVSADAPTAFWSATLTLAGLALAAALRRKPLYR